MAVEPIFVICYDIVGAATRRRVARLLEGEMLRVQESVFEARLRPHRARALFEAAASLAEDGDKLRLYALSGPGAALSATHGGAPLPEAGGFWLL